MTAGPASSPPSRKQRLHELTHAPDGRAWTARENLADLVSRELLGPARGPDEVLEVPPDATYLVGRIAPARLAHGDDDPAPATADPGDLDDSPLDAGADVGDAVEAATSTGVPMSTLAEEHDESLGEVDHDSVQDAPQKRGLMIPASMGLRFQVPLDQVSVRITASWGRYESVDSGKQSKTGTPIRHFKRTPVSHTRTVHVAELTPGTTHVVPLVDDVCLRLDAAPDAPRDRMLVEIALCNDRETPRRIPVDAWLFQTTIEVDSGTEREPVFLPVSDAELEDYVETEPELQRLQLQYRDRLEYALGRTCSVDWTADPGARRATVVRTTWLPVVETPQTRAESIPGATLDMRALADEATDLNAGLRPIVEGYAAWLDTQQARIPTLPQHLQSVATEAVEEAEQVRDQLRDGLDFLLGSPDARACFRFMNTVMADQRVRSQVAELRVKDPVMTVPGAEAAIDALGPDAHSWRVFQLAFVLMQLRALCEPHHQARSGELSRVELLFFPTGGGKTEAYLGLAAFTFAIRRLQGTLTTADGEPLDGHHGVAVLMRYTLRLLTSQQFQRATTLVCAAELARRADEATWGTEPFRIGLWVGTDVSPKRVAEARDELAKVRDQRGKRLTVLQIKACPWCGTPITEAQLRIDDTDDRVYVFCGDDLATCPFSEGGAVPDGLPVLTVDDEIYRLAPTYVIATVDKFARLAREGHAAHLFGYTGRRCDRHGFTHVDYQGCSLQLNNKHPKSQAVLRPYSRLRPPDLVIQDELHLITDALGTTVGLFEAAVDVLTQWRDAAGRPVNPLTVASTATARNAQRQVRSLYGRDLRIFPPRVLDVDDTFFSTAVPITPEAPGRRYLGVSTTGVRLTSAEIRIAEVLLASGQLLLDTDEAAADPYLTLVGYFSATRELAGMSRYLGDDVQTALSKGRPWSGLPRRTGTAYGALNISELTSRVSGSDITDTLQRMAVPFDPAFDSSAARRSRREAVAAGQNLTERSATPYDVVLATSMLQVGVDVTRLGLMLMVGQPKNTAEYIQASSRVGRAGDRPGLVVSLGNWARPRDLAHFEQFRHYHETFYAQVEALSVTPYSQTALLRGLEGVLVSVARVTQAGRADGLSPEAGAGRVATERDALLDAVDRLRTRIRRGSDDGSADFARHRLQALLDKWSHERDRQVAAGLQLVYERVWDASKVAPLMLSAENARPEAGGGHAPPFVVPNSMREVQPEINLLVSPDPKRLHVDLTTAPAWTLPAPEGGDDA